MRKMSVSHNKRLAINMVTNIVSYSSTLLISFVLTPYLINVLGREAYSFYPIANNIISYMAILTNALNTMASRYITIEITKKHSAKANAYFSSVFFANVFISVPIAILMFAIILFANRVLSIPVNILGSVRLLFSFTFSSMLINLISSVFGVATFATNRIDLRSLRELVMSIVRLILLYLLYRFFKPTIAYVGLVALLVALLNLIFQATYTKILLPQIHVKRTNFKWNYVWEIVTSGLWNSLDSLGNILLVSTSLLLANIFYGADQAGQYAIVQTVPNFINGVISMLVGVFYPVIMIRFAENDTVGLLREVTSSQRIVGWLTTSVIGCFIGLSADFFNLWVPGEDTHSLVLLSTITIIPHILIGCVWTLSNLNIVMNKIKIPAIYLLASGLVNMVLTIGGYVLFHPGIWFVPAISSIIQAIWVGVFIPSYSSKVLGISEKIFLSPMMKGIIGSVIGWIVTSVSSNFIHPSGWIQFLLIGSISGGVTLVINAIIMFPWGALVEIPKKLLRNINS